MSERVAASYHLKNDLKAIVFHWNLTSEALR